MKSQNILFVSYFSAINGMVMAEWADDKIRALNESEFKKIIVLTGITSNSTNFDRVKYYKIPPLSPRELFAEVKNFKLNSKILILKYFWFFPFIFTIGIIYDLLSVIFIGTKNPARWSWVVSAFPVGIYLKFRFKCKVLFATGGALSGQVLGCLLSTKGKTKLILEFQDPFVENEIIRNTVNNFLMRKLEHFMIRKSTKVYYVTKAAANACSRRHLDLTTKIFSIYPGSWDFGISEISQPTNENTDYLLIHVGTLYGNRNLKNLFQVIDEEILSGHVKFKYFKILNIGTDYTHLKPKKVRYVCQSLLKREEALLSATKANFLLLIQHTDDRSQQTIPYKTYDYLNLGKQIFALTNNDELKNLILEYDGIVADINDLKSIYIGVNQLMERIENKKVFKVKKHAPNIIEQTKLMLN